jgi:ribulose-phosphate 3-epimerase
MAIICPTVTAFDEYDYNEQIKTLKIFATHIHIDLMDGQFAPTQSPDLDHIWWPPEFTVDIHLMYQRPMDHIDQLIKLKPRMVIIHNEADVHHMDFAARLHTAGIQAGLAVLHDTPIEWTEQIMHSFDHLLIFSGNLGYQGGSTADLGCLDKVAYVKQHHPDAEIGWDGGINQLNAAILAGGGVDVLNVGGFIKNAEDPRSAYATLESEVTSDNA